jgi:hypothetical protein
MIEIYSARLRDMSSETTVQSTTSDTEEDNHWHSTEIYH